MPDGSADAGLLAAILSEVLELRAEVRALRRPANGTDDPLVAELVAYYGGGAECTTADALADAQLEDETGDDRLRVALARADVRLGDPHASTKLGTYLKGAGAERIKKNRRGATVWRLPTLPPATLCTPGD